ncbi:hypothetical protein GCM10007096_26150 [Pullulanibacillus pueri]|uniref:Uncharacterized protein n=1 Tax=Pullulanibacillus pueri TaxID=1437324 RepID=A0A8J3ENC1_9BACL|nr:hypothetical protein GCM10007096_26150 [Pullulanibacillus pueri]
MRLKRRRGAQNAHERDTMMHELWFRAHETVGIRTNHDRKQSGRAQNEALYAQNNCVLSPKSHHAGKTATNSSKVFNRLLVLSNGF